MVASLKLMARPLALADTVPNTEALALSPTVGWLLLACAVAVFVMFAVQAEGWRRFWLTREDPRSMAVFRIVFGTFLICNVNDLWEHFEYLFTDEGIFTADVARQVFASGQFTGYGDGLTPDDPRGFFGLEGLLEYLKGPKYSLLFFWDSPAFFWAYLVVFELIAAMFVVGFFTRTTGVLTWFLMNGLFYRNNLFWEGTEVVYRCFLVYLLCARAGHAYSVDNWLRCRRLRKAGLLSERDGPGHGAGLAPSAEYPRGLEPVYRLIPGWPRRLLMLQLATVYLTTGLLKNGSIWWSGDPLYYALNLDHFYRFPPQYTASLLGTNAFRVLSYSVKFGQILFPVVLVGIIWRFAKREGIPALTGVRRRIVQGSFAALIALSAALIAVTWKVHFTPLVPMEAFIAGWVALWAGVWWLWWRLGAKPAVVTTVLRHRLPEPVVLDRDWFCRWVLGRRLWLTWHIGFHAHIFTLMNVGHFQTGMLSATFVFLEGHEIALLLRAIGRRLASWGVPGIPADVRAGEPPLPAEDTRRWAPRDAARLPDWAIFSALGLGLAGVLVRVFGPFEWAENGGQLNWSHASWDWRLVWGAGLLLLAGAGVQAWWVTRRSAPAEGTTSRGRPPAPWAYGPLGRFVAGLGIVWHLTAVAVWLMPDKDSLGTFRERAQQVFSKWLTTTTTEQGWGMFAPNPPQSNVFLKVLVTDANGEVWDLKTDVYAEERKPIPWIWNDRIRKINRRIIGGESGPTEWYRAWHARYHCRAWALAHDGVAPKKVELVKLWYRIPSPEQMRDLGYYIPERLLERSGVESVSHTEECAKTLMGQLSSEIRSRHGLPALEKDDYKPWLKPKKPNWDKKHPQ